MASPIDPGHYPDSVLLALVHQQPFEGALASRAHVTDCPTCGARLQELTAEDTVIGDLLAELDHPATPTAMPVLTGARRGPVRRAGLAAAAAVVLGTAALAALPASPLHRLLFERAARTPATTTAAGAARPSEAPLASGIAIPATRVLEVHFVRDQHEGVIELRRVPGSDVALRSRGGTTAYDVADGAVVVDNLVPAATYLIDLPRMVHQVRITVGSRTVLRWPADSARGVVRDPQGTIRVPLTTTPETP